MAPSTLDEPYMLTRSTTESNRLDWQHHWAKALSSHQLIHPSIPLNSLSTIADIATGTGAWIRDLACNWPETLTKPLLFAFDISPIQFPNETDQAGIHFRVHDASKPFPDEYHGTFDLVNVRLVSYAITAADLPAVVHNVAALLRPGGYLNWQECDILDAWASPATSTARAVVEMVLWERVERGLTPTIVTPLLSEIASCSARLPEGMANSMTGMGDGLRVMQLQTISTENHPDTIVRQNTSAVITTTIVALLRSGVERRKAMVAQGRDRGEVEANGEMKAMEKMKEMEKFANAFGTGKSEDLAASVWNCEMTWIVARKAIIMGRGEDWMSARYGNYPTHHKLAPRP
jgi:SAM-dependent methyltransferase